MNHKELTLLNEMTDGAQPLVRVQSRTRIDTGSWLCKRPVWICVYETELILLAVSRRRFIERFKLSDIADSHYNHMTGEFVIYPVEGLRYDSFRVSAREALEIMQCFKSIPQPSNQPIPSVA